MVGKKKLSGAQNKKRKANENKQLAKLEGSFRKYLRVDPEPCSVAESSLEKKSEEDYTPSFSTQEEKRKEGNGGDNNEKYESQRDLQIIEEQNEDPTNQLADSGEPKIVTDDPNTWINCCIDKLRTTLVLHGLKQVQDFYFPYDSNHRRFSKVHYKRRWPNGETDQRTWLLYSKATDSVYCFCCKLFSKSSLQSTSALSTTGTKDWKNISTILGNHETSRDHMACFKDWKELETRLRENKTIDEENQRAIKAEESYWRKVLKRLLALVRVLGAQNLAFRGTNEKLYQAGNGNFLKFLEFLAMFDPFMCEHLRKINDKETKVHYLTKDIQNEMIKLLANAVEDKIISTVDEAKYFSLILDCTPDASHVEQLTIIVRVVALNDMKTNCEIKEHFLGFIPLTSTTGAGLTEAILEKMTDLKLHIENLRGQGYDNGSNMKGKNVGVQKRILDVNPRAFYVPCSAHSLNLVVNDAAQCCLEATSFFTLLQEVYVFFSASTQRWSVLIKHVTSLTVKPLSDTRWESRIDAIRPLRYQLLEVHEALMDIYEDTQLTGPTGNQTRVKASGLAKGISKYKFIVSLIVWHNILFEVNLTSKQLQSKTLDLSAAQEYLLKSKTYLEKCRSDEGFESMLVDARELAEELQVAPSFEVEGEPIRLKRIKKQFDYEANDEFNLSAKDQFKVKFYFAILDKAINSIDERFKQMQEVTTVFGVLFKIQEFQEITDSKALLEECVRLEKSLTHKNSKDINGAQLYHEIKSVARRVSSTFNPQDTLNYICQNNLVESLPNLFIALRIFLTLPVSVASGERSFSKLKLIKTYLRSTMSQERLVGLATLSIEQDLAKSVDLNNLVSSFAIRKSRKVSIE